MDKVTGSSLEELLDGDAAPEQGQAAPVSEPVPTGDTTAPPAGVQPSTDKQTPQEAPLIPRAAYEDERRKRQEREREAEDYKRRLDEAMRQIQQAGRPTQPEAQPDWLIEPEKAAQRQQEAFERQMFETRVHLSQEMMRSAKPDYEEMEQAFADEALKDPSLQAQLLRHPAPAKFAYEMGRRIKLMREIGDDPSAYRARLEQEILSQYGITPKGAAPAVAQRQPVNAPKSLASVTSAPNRDASGRFAAPRHKSLDDILGE